MKRMTLSRFPSTRLSSAGRATDAKRGIAFEEIFLVFPGNVAWSNLIFSLGYPSIAPSLDQAARKGRKISSSFSEGEIFNCFAFRKREILSCESLGSRGATRSQESAMGSEMRSERETRHAARFEHGTRRQTQRNRTWHLQTTSASIASMSTTFPLPSSPHCAPRTTVTFDTVDVRCFFLGEAGAPLLFACIFSWMHAGAHQTRAHTHTHTDESLDCESATLLLTSGRVACLTFSERDFSSSRQETADTAEIRRIGTIMDRGRNAWKSRLHRTPPSQPPLNHFGRGIPPPLSAPPLLLFFPSVQINLPNLILSHEVCSF